VPLLSLASKNKYQDIQEGEDYYSYENDNFESAKKIFESIDISGDDANQYNSFSFDKGRSSNEEKKNKPKRYHKPNNNKKDFINSGSVEKLTVEGLFNQHRLREDLAQIVKLPPKTPTKQPVTHEPYKIRKKPTKNTLSGEIHRATITHMQIHATTKSPYSITRTHAPYKVKGTKAPHNEMKTKAPQKIKATKAPEKIKTTEAPEKHKIKATKAPHHKIKGTKAPHHKGKGAAKAAQHVVKSQPIPTTVPTSPKQERATTIRQYHLEVPTTSATEILIAATKSPHKGYTIRRKKGQGHSSSTSKGLTRNPVLKTTKVPFHEITRRSTTLRSIRPQGETLRPYTYLDQYMDAWDSDSYGESIVRAPNNQQIVVKTRPAPTTDTVQIINIEYQTSRPLSRTTAKIRIDGEESSTPVFKPTTISPVFVSRETSTKKWIPVTTTSLPQTMTPIRLMPSPIPTASVRKSTIAPSPAYLDAYMGSLESSAGGNVEPKFEDLLQFVKKAPGKRYSVVKKKDPNRSNKLGERTTTTTVKPIHLQVQKLTAMNFGYGGKRRVRVRRSPLESKKRRVVHLQKRERPIFRIFLSRMDGTVTKRNRNSKQKNKNKRRRRPANKNKKRKKNKRRRRPRPTPNTRVKANTEKKRRKNGGNKRYTVRKCNRLKNARRRRRCVRNRKREEEKKKKRKNLQNIMNLNRIRIQNMLRIRNRIRNKKKSSRKKPVAVSVPTQAEFSKELNAKTTDDEDEFIDWTLEQEQKLATTTVAPPSDKSTTESIFQLFENVGSDFSKTVVVN